MNTARKIVGILLILCALLSTASAAVNNHVIIKIGDDCYKVTERDKISDSGINYDAFVDYIAIPANEVEEDSTDNEEITEEEDSTEDAEIDEEEDIKEVDNGSKIAINTGRKSLKQALGELVPASSSTDEKELTCSDGMCSVDSLEPEESTVTDTETEDDEEDGEEDKLTTKFDKKELIAFFDENTCSRYNSVNGTKYAFEIKQKLADENVSSSIASVTMIDGTKIYMNEVELKNGDVVTAYCDGTVRDVLSLTEGKKLVTKRLCSVCPLKTTGERVETIFRDTDN